MTVTVMVVVLLLLLLKYSAPNIDIPAVADTHTHTHIYTILILDIMGARPAPTDIQRNYLWVVFEESKMIGLGALNAGGGWCWWQHWWWWFCVANNFLPAFYGPTIRKHTSMSLYDSSYNRIHSAIYNTNHSGRLFHKI